MSNRRVITKDVKKSIGLLLALMLVFSGFFSMPIGAAETLEIVDTSKMIGVGYKPGETTEYYIYPGFVFQSYEKVIIKNTGGVDMSNSPVLDAVLYLTIGGNEYEVIKYSSSPAYRSGGIELTDLGDGVYSIWIAPRYYNAGGYSEALQTNVRNEITDNVYGYASKNDHATIYCKDDPYFGFTEEFINALAAENIIDMNDIDWSKVVDYLSSKEMNKKFTIKYTLKDASDNSAEYIDTGVSVYNYQVDDYSPPEAYLYGKRVGYNRIEDLSSLHDNDEYNYIKMYKGNIYVNADSLTALGDTLNIPNANNSELYYINSVLINDDIMYNDGYAAMDLQSGYNICEGAFPQLMETEDDAIEGFLDIMTGKYYVESDFDTTEEYYKYQNSYWMVNYFLGHTFEYGDNRYSIYAYNEYEDIANGSDFIANGCVGMDKKAVFVDAFNSGEHEEDYFCWDSAAIPEISLVSLNSENIDDYYNYISTICTGFGVSYDSTKAYKVMSGDTVVAEWTLDVTKALLESISYAFLDGYTMDNIPDNYAVYDRWTYTSLQINTITDLVPINDIYKNNNDWAGYYLFEEINENNGFNINADEMESLLQAVGLNKSDMTIWLEVDYNYIPYSSDYTEFKNAIIQAVKTNYGEDVYEAFRAYILEEYVVLSKKINFSEDDDSDKNTSVDVYAEELKIPLSYFDVTALGKKNAISQLWYLGHDENFLMPVEGYYNNSKEILYHGKYLSIGYNRVRFSSYYYDSPLETVYNLEYDYIYETALGTVVFAKVPDQIAAKTEIYSTTDTYEISWDVPADNGAEILGYQIAVVPRTAARSVVPTDDQYITVGNTAGSYSDVGDNYTIKWSTAGNSYVVETNGTSVDVYVRAVNVIGAAKPQVFSIINPYESISILGDDTVKAGENGSYDVFNLADTNVESDCTYSLQDNPDGITISEDGTLTVSSTCTVTSVTIVATGKTGTNYDGKTASKTVTITTETSEVTPDNTDDIPDNDPDNVVDPDAGCTIIYVALVALLAGATTNLILRKKLIFK